MGHRIDGPGDVPDQHCPDKHAPDQQAGAKLQRLDAGAALQQGRDKAASEKTSQDARLIGM